jgi:hypothetical protein
VEKPAWPAAVYLGLTLAAAGYSHAVVFTGGIMIAVIASVIGVAVGAARKGARGAWAPR